MVATRQLIERESTVGTVLSRSMHAETSARPLRSEEPRDPERRLRCVQGVLQGGQEGPEKKREFKAELLEALGPFSPPSGSLKNFWLQIPGDLANL